MYENEVNLFSFRNSAVENLANDRSSLFKNKGILFYVCSSRKTCAQQIYSAIVSMGGKVLPIFSVHVTHMIFHFGYADFKERALQRKKRTHILHYSWLQECWNAADIVSETSFDFSGDNLNPEIGVWDYHFLYQNAEYSPAYKGTQNNSKIYRWSLTVNKSIDECEEMKKVYRQLAASRLEKELETEKFKEGYGALRERNEKLIGILRSPLMPYSGRSLARIEEANEKLRHIESIITEERKRKVTETGRKIHSSDTEFLVKALQPRRIIRRQRRSSKLCSVFPWETGITGEPRSSMSKNWEQSSFRTFRKSSLIRIDGSESGSDEVSVSSTEYDSDELKPAVKRSKIMPKTSLASGPHDCYLSKSVKSLVSIRKELRYNEARIAYNSPSRPSARNEYSPISTALSERPSLSSFPSLTLTPLRACQAIGQHIGSNT